MSFLAQCLIGVLAAIGFVCILKTGYDIIFIEPWTADGMAELYIYGDGTDERTEQLLLAAEQVRRLYLPGLAIVFVDEASADDPRWNYAAHLAQRRDFAYYH